MVGLTAPQDLRSFSRQRKDACCQIYVRVAYFFRWAVCYEIIKVIFSIAFIKKSPLANVDVFKKSNTRDVPYRDYLTCFLSYPFLDEHIIARVYFN